MGLQAIGPVVRTLQDQLDEGDTKLSSLEASIVALDNRLDTMETQQAKIIEIYEGITVLIKVFAGIEKFAVWVAKVAAALGIVWAIWKFAIMQAIADSLKGK